MMYRFVLKDTKNVSGISIFYINLKKCRLIQKYTVYIYRLEEAIAIIPNDDKPSINGQEKNSFASDKYVSSIRAIYSIFCWERFQSRIDSIFERTDIVA
ncbi:hypothetical protein RCL_jg15017.t2 [Rhizophagus clarus]|uniref:Uncharacterized protein n=1 Tax=Rhizophagus clarus TaxID=94130 RepID=A0A8H3M7K6_9GLOM|nr:hypothetical protein RCL_jg15017.t2 [Rhizophagus clarus]